jgi:GT2 family glycosyltransferase
VKYVREEFPWVNTLALSENIGFAAGNNLGFHHCSGEYIVALNNDTKFDPHFLSSLVAVADAEPRSGMVAARMLNFYDPDRIDSIGIAAARNGMGFSRGLGKLAGEWQPDRYLFGPCGGAALYRRAMLDDVGFFDEDFFAYYEDLDLAWRGRLAGWDCAVADATVWHIHSATSGIGSAFTTEQLHRNKWHVIIKNWPFILLVRYLPLIFLYDLGALFLACLNGRALPAVRARWKVVVNLRTLLRKRKMIQNGRKVPVARVGQLLSSVPAPWHTAWRKLHNFRTNGFWRIKP